MKYKVKRLCSKGKNSLYTISPGVYEANSESQEVWDYLLKLGSNCIETIKDVPSPTPCDLGNCPLPKPRRKKIESLNIENENENQNQNKENI